MSIGIDLGSVTTDAAVSTYEAAAPIFEGLLKEMRELSRKKPEAIMNAGKVSIINRVLDDLLIILEEEPSGKYLDVLDNESLPQVSDAVLTMVQFETALGAFRDRYRQYLYGDHHWITTTFVEEWKAQHSEGD